MGPRPEPGDVVPVQGGVDEAAHDAAVAASPLVVLGRHADHGRRQGFICFDALVGFAFPGRRRVGGDEDGGDVGVVVESVEEGFGFVALFVDVELEEEGVGGGRGGGCDFAG